MYIELYIQSLRTKIVASPRGLGRPEGEVTKLRNEDERETRLRTSEAAGACKKFVQA